jgi:hypothetical protein
MKKIALIAFLTLPILAQNNQNPPENQPTANETARAPGQVEWGSAFNTVRENIKGELKYYNENKIIVSQEGEITYSYGFFFADPEMIGEESTDTATQPAQQGQPAQGNQGADQNPAANPNQQAQAQPQANDPQFSYVIMQFPYLSMDEIKAKYVEKYGEPSSQLIENNSGVIIWESEETLIAMWIDEYEDQPYCRKINYLSKEFTEKLADYNFKIFNQKEIDTLNRLDP